MRTTTRAMRATNNTNSQIQHTNTYMDTYKYIYLQYVILS